MILTLKPIYNNLKTKFNQKDFRIIDEAFLFAQEKHKGQKRASGEDFVLHPLRVAIELSRLKPEINTIVAALLHDVLEDTSATEKEIKEKFGEDVFNLIKSLSNIKVIQRKITDRSKNLIKLENLRNLILATSKDVRVILVKLFDRLDNMRSAWALSAESQYKNGVETLEIFAPLCYRLGLGYLGQLLEEVSFPYVYPKEFMAIKNKVADYYYRIEKLLNNSRDEMLIYFKENRFVPLEIQFRKKTFSSIYRKLKKEGSFEKIYDIIAFRVLTKNINDCYVALGLIHRLWLPIPDRLKDYIALPKPNGYKAIHTTVLTNNNQIVEVQVMSQDMFYNNEYGVAAHWIYNLTKETKQYAKRQKISGASVLYSSLRDIDIENIEPQKLFEVLTNDILSEQIFVVTPEGDVLDLKAGSTPLDFAYKIHSDVGNRCKMAKVNNHLVPLGYKLSSGDVVEIITNKKQKPSKKWVELAKMTETKRKIIDGIRKTK